MTTANVFSFACLKPLWQARLPRAIVTTGGTEGRKSNPTKSPPNDRVAPLFSFFVRLTPEAVGHVGFEDDLAEDGGQREGLVAFVPQRDVTVAGLQAVQRQDALADQLVVVVVHGQPQHRQIRQDHLQGNANTSPKGALCIFRGFFII